MGSFQQTTKKYTYISISIFIQHKVQKQTENSFTQKILKPKDTLSNILVAQVFKINF